VLDESWDGGVGVVQAKVKAGVPNWDAVQVEAEELAIGCADGIYEKIDWAKLGGKDKFLDSAVNDCGVGAIVWSTMLSYDSEKLKTAPTSWADFWDTTKFPGKRALRRGPKYALEFALMADGVAAKDVYATLCATGGVDRAFKKLDEIKGDMIWWESGAQPLQLLKSGQVVMTSAYNGRISGINKTEGTKFKTVWPGSIYAVDSWVILKGSPNKDARWTSSPSPACRKTSRSCRNTSPMACPTRRQQQPCRPKDSQPTCRPRPPTSRARSRSISTSGTTTSRT
jgi:putative spermidine/putrescine transport system substrate-binding protein